MAALFEGWPLVHERVARWLAVATDADLTLRASEDGWPVWAMLAHVASARVYWLCTVCGEPGAETTPFGASDEFWEDRLDIPRGVVDVRVAWATTWRIVDAVNTTWTPALLEGAFERIGPRGDRQVRTRRSILTRLLMHDTFHTGEASLVLGMHGRGSLDPWEPAPPS